MDTVKDSEIKTSDQQAVASSSSLSARTPASLAAYHRKSLHVSVSASMLEDKKHVLIVDDEEMDQMFVCHCVNRALKDEVGSAHSFLVLRAASVDEAKHLYDLHAESIVLVVTDFNMPEASGDILVRYIRGRESIRMRQGDVSVCRVPIIAYTAADEGPLQLLREAGTDVVISKPNTSALQIQMRHFLSSRRASTSAEPLVEQAETPSPSRAVSKS